MMTTKRIPVKNCFNYNPSEICIVGLDEPFTDVDPSHELFDSRKDLPVDNNFVEDVALNGQIHPITVTKIGSAIVVVDGRQRLKAIRKVNEELKKKGLEESDLLLVKCSFVQHSGFADMLGMLMSANSHHQADLIMEKARKAARLINLGKDVKEVAVRSNVTKQTIDSWLKLLQCIPAVQNAVDTGKISASAAAELADLSSKEQMEMLKKLLENSEKKVTRKKVKKQKGESTAPGKRLVKKIVMSDNSEELFPNDFRQGAMWAIGCLPTHELPENIIDAIEEIMDM
jgi:hypothetical protein